MKDEELVKQFRNGSKEAFGELVRRHSRPLAMMILRIVRDEEETRDISQSVFLRAYEAIPRFMMASSFKTWLYSIALNAVRDHLKRRSPVIACDAPDELPDPSQTPAEQLEKAHQYAALRKLVEELPMKQRLTLQLRLYEGMDYTEIAQVLGGTAAGARSNFFHAVKTLRGQVKSNHEKD